MSNTAPRPNKRRRPSRRRWRREEELRQKSQRLRAKLERPRTVTFKMSRVLARMGQHHYTTRRCTQN